MNVVAVTAFLILAVCVSAGVDLFDHYSFSAAASICVDLQVGTTCSSVVLCASWISLNCISL